MSWLGYGIIGVARRQVGNLHVAGNKPAQGCSCASAVQHRDFPLCCMQWHQVSCMLNMLAAYLPSGGLQCYTPGCENGVQLTCCLWGSQLICCSVGAASSYRGIKHNYAVACICMLLSISWEAAELHCLLPGKPHLVAGCSADNTDLSRALFL